MEKERGIKITNIDKQKQCDIHVVSRRSFRELEHLAEELECANMYLDDLNVPKKDGSGEEYSIVGRIKYLEKNGF